MELRFMPYTLIDSQQRHKEHPQTWHTPSDDELDAIKVGYYVKIGLQGPLGGERPWAKVQKKTEQGYEVEIVNHLLLHDEIGLDLGSQLLIQRQHILDVLPPREV